MANNKKYISKITPLDSSTTYYVKDEEAIANISRNDTTFTATRRDGTTFTFTQNTDYLKVYKVKYYGDIDLNTEHYIYTDIIASNTDTLWIHGEISGTKGTSNVSFVRFTARCYKINADSGEAYSLRYWDPMDVLSEFKIYFDNDRKVYFSFKCNEKYSYIKALINKNDENGNVNHVTSIEDTVPTTTKGALGIKVYSTLANSSISIAGNDVALGGSLSAAILKESLGLSNAVHFIGIATNAITDNVGSDPGISGYTWPGDYQAGDIILVTESSNAAKEYILTADKKWELFGPIDSIAATLSAGIENSIAYYSAASTVSALSSAESTSYLLKSGSSSAAPSWIQYTSSNTASTIVQRDASGDFSAGIITATLNGNASTATKVNNDLVIKINTGTTEGTSLYTFNGSAAKTLDIKPGTGISLTAGSGTLTVTNIGVTSVKGNAETNYRTGDVNLTPANILGTGTTGQFWRGDNSWSNTLIDDGARVVFTDSVSNRTMWVGHQASQEWMGLYESTTDNTKVLIARNATSGKIGIGTSAPNADYNITLSGATEIDGKAHITNTTSNSLTSVLPAFTIGTVTDSYLGLSPTGIQAKNGATTSSTLNLNYYGGPVNIGTTTNVANTTISGYLTIDRRDYTYDTTLAGETIALIRMKYNNANETSPTAYDKYILTAIKTTETSNIDASTILLNSGGGNLVLSAGENNNSGAFLKQNGVFKYGSETLILTSDQYVDMFTGTHNSNGSFTAHTKVSNLGIQMYYPNASFGRNIQPSAVTEKGLFLYDVATNTETNVDTNTYVAGTYYRVEKTSGDRTFYAASLYNTAGTFKSLTLKMPYADTAAYITWSDGRVGNSIYPTSTNTYNLGSLTARWKNIYGGKVQLNPAGSDLTNSYNEGLRVNRSGNGWAAIGLGGADGTETGTGLGVWLIGAKSTPADATTAAASITDSQFYISYNGSNNAACRIQGHNATGFSVRPRLAINADVNTSYNLYVNGASYFNGNTTHNGIDYFANGTTYYINNSGTGNLNALTVNNTTASTTTGTGGLIVKGGAGIAGRATASEFNATRKMVISAGKVYSNISGSNVILPAKTSMLFADGLAIANPGLSGANDVGWLRVTGTAESDMVLELATGDDGGAGETIHARQYNASNNIVNDLTILDTLGNTQFAHGFKIYYTKIPKRAHINAAGWWKIAHASSYFNFDIYINGGWETGSPTVTVVNITNRSGTAIITQKSGISGTIGEQIKLGKTDTNDWDVLVYIPQYATDKILAQQNYTFIGIGGLTLYEPSTRDTTAYDVETVLALKYIYGNAVTTSHRTIAGSNHAEALKADFDSYKSIIPRNHLMSYYSSAYSNGSQAFGYFLSGHDSAPYGGFFVAHYNQPRYIGISNGTYTERCLATSNNASAFTLNQGTANTMAYYSSAGTISSGSITTDGSYLRNVGGYNNTSYAFSAASAIINSWIRTTGSTGWYNQDYKAGWYMRDDDFVRLYGNKQVRIQSSHTASATNLTSQLIIGGIAYSDDANTTNNHAAIELWRGTRASWQIANDTSGVLHIRNNYTSAVQTSYTQESLILDYNTGAGSIPYLAIGQTARNTSYRLYVNGTSYHKGLDTHEGNIVPSADLSYNIGTNTKRFLNVFTNCLELSGPNSNPSATTGGRIKFSYDASANTGGSQPVYISYTPNDTYRSPAGLKVFGGTDATPAWFEVEGNSFIGSTSMTSDRYLNISTGTTHWSYLRLNNGSNVWDIATKSNDCDDALQLRPKGSGVNAMRISLTGNIYLAQNTAKQTAPSSNVWKYIFFHDKDSTSNYHAYIGAVHNTSNDHGLYFATYSSGSAGTAGGATQLQMISTNGARHYVQIPTHLRVINNSSNDSDDSLLYIENKNSSDWAQKINLDTYNYGLFIQGTGTSLLKVGTDNNFYVNSDYVGTNLLLKITKNSNTVTIGSANASYTHFSNSADIPFYFNKSIWVDGDLYPYGTTNTRSLGKSDKRWKALFVGTADSYGSNVKPIYWNAGVPKAIDYSINASISAGTANQLAYYSAATTISGTPNITRGATSISIEGSSSASAQFLVSNGTNKISLYQAAGGNRGIYQNAGDVSGGWLLYWPNGSKEAHIVQSNLIIDAGNLYAGTTAATAERSIRARAKAGEIYVYSAGSATGNRGIWLINSSTDTSSGLLIVNQKNYITTHAAMAVGLGYRFSATVDSNPINISSYPGTSAIGSTNYTNTTIDQGSWGQIYFRIPALHKVYATNGDTSSSVTSSSYYQPYWWFRQWSVDTSTGARTARCESYSLPACDHDRTANASYMILTTKNYTSYVSPAANVTSTAATGTTKYYLLGQSAAGNQKVYIATANSSGTANTTGVYFQGSTGVLFGAAWNDYAEFRKSHQNIEIEPGRVVKEIGDDSLELASSRLQRGCQIVSDTYGFAINEREGNKLPLAVAGRVLAYPYESLDDFKECIGWPVCSGPNGTVSIMTEEEEREFPSRIIGTISAVPDYEIWHGGTDIAVNGRVWIKVR